MKRRIFTILIFLPFGTIVNFAVALSQAWIHRGQIIMERCEWGWPFDALYRGPWVSFEFQGAQIPYQPVWSGCAANTIFYATVLWLTTFGPLALCRFIRSVARDEHRIKRHERGQCAECGYDLRGDFDTGCPECGWNREPEVTR